MALSRIANSWSASPGLPSRSTKCAHPGTAGDGRRAVAAGGCGGAEVYEKAASLLQTYFEAQPEQDVPDDNGNMQEQEQQNGFGAFAFQ